MDLITSIEDGSRIRKEKGKEAIYLALEGRWRESIPINEIILAFFPNDTEALSRIGKAYLELGDYPNSRKNFQKVLDISPYNSIAKRNLSRLERLPDNNGNVTEARKVRPFLFLEESGKSGVTHLTQTSSEHILAKVAAGDVVNFTLIDNKLGVLNQDGDTLGFVETRLGSRLGRLIKLGVLYDAAVLRVDGDNLSVIVHETFRDPNILDVCSFPSTKKLDRGGNIVEFRQRYNIDDELEDGYDDDTLDSLELDLEE